MPRRQRPRRTGDRVKAFVLKSRVSSGQEFADVPVPALDDDEILVRVRAIGVGVHDAYFIPQEAIYPYPIGIEAAGVVEAVGADVTARQPGDRVAITSSMQPKGGTWAEYAVARSGALILPIPDEMSFVQAAAVPVAANTALKALSAAEVPDAGTLFISGGAGAIGTLAIQLARQRGWRVAASASPTNHEYLAKLGAEKAVDYHDPQWTEQIRRWAPDGVDAAIAVHPGTTATTAPVVRDGGALVSVSGDALHEERGIRMSGIPYQVDVSAELDQLLRDARDRALHLEIAHVFDFDEASAALAQVHTRHTRGKVVIAVP